MNEAVIVDIIRTPGGKRNGQFRDWHPASLAAFVLNALTHQIYTSSSPSRTL
ncbi:MAG: hypothetical protein ACYCU8_15900 [Ferrimicrobium acidiphilum]